MRKIILGTFVVLSSIASAQTYQDYYPSGNGDPYSNNEYYGDDDDQYYFPDDYYYEYPSDYYADDYYRNSYNDYRRSIDGVNWNRLFVQFRLAPWQVEQIMYLNSMYASYAMWNEYYRYNPDRWYYDRFYALERILGPSVFGVYQNTYYGGYSPVVYWQNYRARHYSPSVFISARYRNININIYHINRNVYHRNNGYFYSPRRQDFGFKNSPRSGANGNWNNRNEGFRSSVPNRNNSGIRNERDSGFRSGTRSGAMRDTSSPKILENRNSNNGMRSAQSQQRNNQIPRVTERSRSNSSDGFRSSSPQQRSTERSSQKSVSPSRSKSEQNSRISGQRLVSR